jgi:hypothetical protein
MIDPNSYITVNKVGRFRRGLMDPFISFSIPENVDTILDLGCGSA